MAFNKTSKAIPILAGAFIAAGLLIYFIFFYQKGHEWDNMNYQYNNKEPYGTSVLYNFLKSSWVETGFVRIDKSISHFLKNKNEIATNYIIINNYVKFNSLELNDLLTYVQRGNTALIIVSGLDKDLEATISGVKQLIELEEDKQIEEENASDTTQIVEKIIEENPPIAFNNGEKFGRIKFSDLDLQKDNPHTFFYKYKLDTIDYYWNYANDEKPPLFEYKTLAIVNNDRPSFIEVSAGKGRFLIHYNPIAFSNYHLLRKDGKTHLAKVLSYLSPGKIYWDNFSYTFRFDFSEMGYNTDTPLSYILSKPSLAWAFYVLLTCSLLFVVFNAKRIQQSIPLIAPKVNSSLEYIRSVGRLYYQHRKNQELVERIMLQFYTDVYIRYKIQERNRANFIQKLSTRSGVDSEIIIGILRYYDSIEEAIMAPDENTLTQFYQKIQEFNAKRK